MRVLLLLALVSLLVLVCPMISAAEPKSPPPTAGNPVATTSLAGKYSGTWKGPENSGGDLRVTLTREEGGSAWSAEAMFTFEGAEIPTTMKGVTIEGTSRIRLVFTWQIQDTPGQSAMTGELSGDTLQGTYETTGPAGNSKGTWSVTRR
jgi:hypothetical protein